MRVLARACLLLAAAAMTQFWLMSCGDDDWGDRTVIVSGTVTDSATMVPVDSARLTWDDSTDQIAPWFSDSTGAYSVPLRGSNAVLFVRKKGYKTQSRTLTNVTSDLYGVDFGLVIQSRKSERR
jgi:hypothetical protein